MKRAALLALALLLLVAAAAHGAPGGGTSGFGGGGGGGGGGFSGGGSGGSGGGSSGFGGAAVAIIGIFLLIVVLAWIGAVKARKRRRERARRVELAAAEAAGDDAAFGVGVVIPAAAELFHAIMRAWSSRDREALRAHLGPDLMVEWERRLDDFARKGWHNVCSVQKGPSIQYLGLVNRAEDAEDRVTVRIEATLQDYVLDRDGRTIKRNNSNSTTVALNEYWTLGKRAGRWALLSIEQDAEGAHHLEAEIVASPWSDSRLRDEAVAELARADAVPDHEIAGLADLDFDGTARAAALDLAMVDGRFAPEVLETAARRAVHAWAEAVDGDDAALHRAATPAAVRELLHGGDANARTRLVIRGPRLTALRITGLQPGATPPAMTVEADVTARRYREDRDAAAILEGSRDREVGFTERWTLVLDGAGDMPWRIAAAAEPAGARVPSASP